MSFHLLISILTACLVIPAAACDLKRRIIPNHLTMTMLILGFSLHLLHAGPPGLLFSLKGAALGGGIFLLLNILGAMGAGDVKMMAGVGSLLGAGPVTSVLLLTVLIGGLMAAGKIATHVLRRRVMRKTHSSNIPPAGAGDPDSAESNPLRDTIPYGAAIAGGALLTIILHIAAGGPTS